MEEINTDDFVDELCEIDPNYKKEIKELEKKFNCLISCSIEKHNVLQYTYYYDVDFFKEEIFYVEIESGISNGTQLNSSEWGMSTKENTKVIDVLKDIELDSRFYEEGSLLKQKAQGILDTNKAKLFEYNRQNNYDNYVTGGHSKMKLNPLLERLELDYIYEQKEVGCNFL